MIAITLLGSKYRDSLERDDARAQCAPKPALWIQPGGKRTKQRLATTWPQNRLDGAVNAFRADQFEN